MCVCVCVCMCVAWVIVCVRMPAAVLHGIRVLCACACVFMGMCVHVQAMSGICTLYKCVVTETGAAPQTAGRCDQSAVQHTGQRPALPGGTVLCPLV